MRTLLTHATLIDCVTPTPISNAWLLIDDGRIREIGTAQTAPPEVSDATTIDLAGAYLLPGLWDVHVHPDFLSLADVPLPEQVTLFGQRLMAALTESGIVGLRCAGAHHFMDVAWKRAFDSRPVRRPAPVRRRPFPHHHRRPLPDLGPCARVRRALRLRPGDPRADQERRRPHQAQPLGRHHGPGLGPHWHSFLLDDELKAAFEICRLRGFKVMAHATNPEAVKDAIRLGAHSVEHGYIMDDECIELFLKHDTWYVPTLAISHLTPEQATERLGAALGQAAQPGARAVLPRRCRRRTCIATGSRRRSGRRQDGARLRHPAAEGCGAARDGPVGARRRHAVADAACRDAQAAALCGVGSELGTIEVGKLADLIVVAGNPLDDIQNVRRLRLVLKDGRVVSDKRR